LGVARGGGNFGVVTAMHHRLHNLPSVRSGMLIYPFSEAGAVLGRCADIAASAPADLTFQTGCVGGPAARQKKAKRGSRRFSSLEHCSPALSTRHPMGRR